MPTVPPSSPFFRRYQLQLGQPDLAAQLLQRHRMRRVLAVMAVASFIGLAIGSAIYLATPRYASRWHTPPAQARVKTTAVTNEPGTVDLQIQRQKEAQTYRFRKVGEDWVIQNVTPKPVPHKRFPWSKPRQTGS